MSIKIRPLEKKINRNQNLLEDLKEFEGIGGIINKIAEGIIQLGLEKEVTEYIGRGWYERIKEEEEVEEGKRGNSIDEVKEKDKLYRNGYYPRRIKTLDGIMELEVPRVRNSEERYESKILKGLEKNIRDRIQKVVMETIVRGLSYRDVEECFKDEGGRPILSRGSMTEIMEEINKEYEEFRNRDLSGIDIVYLFVDGVYESVKRYTRGQTILCSWGISSNGEKILLGLSAVTSESEESWGEFLEDLKGRGLRQPLLVISDGHKGLIKAITKHFPLSYRQRCIAHKMRNIINKVPLDIQDEIKREVQKIYYSDTLEEAEARAEEFIKRYTDKYPEMIRCFNEDLKSCLEHLKFPIKHRRMIRTTNLIERAFVEEKRRTKIIPYHQNEKGMMILVFGVLIRASLKWNKVKMYEADLALLRNIRKIILPNNNDMTFISFQGVA